MKEECLKKAKIYLDNYKLLKASIERKKRRISEYEQYIKRKHVPKAKKLVDYTEIRTGKKIDNFEKETEKILKIKQEITFDLSLLNEIEESLSSFSEVSDAKEYVDILLYTHFKKINVDEIIGIMNYSSRSSYYKIYKKSLNQFATFLLGSENLQ